MKYKFDDAVKVTRPGFYFGVPGRVKGIDEFVGPDSPHYKVALYSASGAAADTVDFAESELEPR